MWGSFMDKASELASNIDKQLNESVGADATPNLGAKSQPPPAAASSLVAAPIPEAATASATNEQDNAWNDDFAFDDDEEEDPQVAATGADAEEDRPAPAPKEASSEALPPPVVPEPEPEPEPIAPPSPEHLPKSEPVAPPPVPEEPVEELPPRIPTPEPVFPEPTIDAATKVSTTPVEETEDDSKVEEDQTLPDEPLPAEEETPAPAPHSEPEETDPTSEPEAPTEGLEGQDNTDPVIEEEEEFEEPQQPTVEDNPMEEESTPAPPTQVEAEEETELIQAAEPAQEEEEEQVDSKPSIPLPKAAKSMFGALASAVTPLTKDDNETSTPAPAAAAPAFGAMFNSLAQTAGNLAHQAESMVDSAVQEQKPLKAGGSAMSGLLSSFPLGNESQKGAPMEDDGGEDDAGWDVDDFDVTESEDVGDEAPMVVIAPSSKPNEELNGEATKPMDVEPTPLLPDTEQPEQVEGKDTSALPLVDGGSDQASAEETSPPSNSATGFGSDATSGTPLTGNIEDDPRYKQLLEQLHLRENQLTNKSLQLTELQELMDSQERELKQKVVETKEEAKRRLQRAKERCESAEAKLRGMQNSGAADAASQGEIIQALREEGQKLAQKQSAMEQAVRAAKIESRTLAEQLDAERDVKDQGLEKIAKLESELKSTKEFLSSARKGESQAGKLENDLMSARSDAEMKAATILSLQQQLKETTAEARGLRSDLERSRKMAAQEAQQEKKTLRREHNDVISDLETKLRTTEREAGVREDALRHEVTELRKRWQDAVRRADALSMDVQSSTAPLLRQLESMERQNRVRSANWTELENQLRTELEETVIQNEVLTKERNDFKTKYTRMGRSINEFEQDSKVSKRTVEEQTTKIAKLEKQVEDMEMESEKRQEEYSQVERLANEGVMRVRSEMTQTVVDSEERYRGQIDRLEEDLRVEREKRSQLEGQVENLLENAGMIVAPQAQPTLLRTEAKPKKLKQAEGQAEILAGALGFDSDSDDDDDESIGQSMDRGDNPSQGGGMNSFAALEQLTSKLKAAKVELEALRSNLRESEKTRESLVEELGEARSAKEKLPLFEAKVKELTQDNREKEFEIQGLQEDISEVKNLYRTQLSMLLEEKTAGESPVSNGEATPATDEM